MTVQEVYNLYRRYIDEPDLTFVDQAQASQFLDLAYRDFRTLVSSMDPYVFTLSQSYTLSSARFQSLDGTIMGSAAPAASRLYMLRDVFWIDPSVPHYSYGRLRPGTTVEQLVDGRCDYVLVGSTLEFNFERTGTIVVEFIPEPNVDWTTIAATYIDDLNSFHDMIALIAYLQYAIIDSAENPQLLALLAKRTTQLREYLENRSGGIAERVSDVEYM